MKENRTDFFDNYEELR